MYLIVTRFGGLVFRTFLSENCYTLLLQLELVRLNDINGKIETFERFLVIQNALVKCKYRQLALIHGYRWGVFIIKSHISDPEITYNC